MAGSGRSSGGAPRRWTRTRFLVSVLLLVALAVGGLNLVGGSGSGVWTRLGLPTADGAKDTDGDGLPDAVERDGWRTATDGPFKTNPRLLDTDGDGLTDGQEAGQLISGKQSPKVYEGLSIPIERDSDGDEVGDGDEYFLDTDPRLQDTDADGLLDNVELDFGSDPTRDNVDDDSYSDKEEYERSSNPLAYDLTRGQALRAFLGGAAAGDSERLARLARLGDEQRQSPEYLAGQIAGGFIGFGDVRDIAADVGDGDFVGAAVSAAGLAPFAGDAVKTVGTLKKFTRRGERAERAVDAFIERLPGSQSTKKEIRRKVFGSSVRLPAVLVGGPKNNVVYKGSGYVGITDDLPRRIAQHATAGRNFVPTAIPVASGLSRGEARSIEEACIVALGLGPAGGALQNQIHSIDPRAAYYAEAVEWGTDTLVKRGGSCA